MGVYYFINQFMTIGHENGLLYDDYIARNFFGFVKNMSQSQLRVIRHTGVVLGKTIHIYYYYSLMILLHLLRDYVLILLITLFNWKHY